MTISVAQSVSSGIDYASSRNASLTATVEPGDVAVAFGLLNIAPNGTVMSASGLTGGTWETIETAAATNTPGIGAMVCTGFTANGTVTVSLGYTSQSSARVLLLRGVPAGAEFEFVSVAGSPPLTGPTATAPVFVIDVFITLATAAATTWSRAGYTDAAPGIQSNNINATVGVAYLDAASGTPGTSLSNTTNSVSRIGQLRITVPAAGVETDLVAGELELGGGSLTHESGAAYDLVLGEVEIGGGALTHDAPTETDLVAGELELGGGSLSTVVPGTHDLVSGEVEFGGSALTTAGPVIDASLELAIEYDLDFDVRPAGTLAVPLQPTYPASVDLADAVLVASDPAAAFGAGAASMWLVVTTTSVSTSTYTWTGAEPVGLEVWMAADALGTWEPDEITRIASSDTGSVTWDSGENATYYLRVYPLATPSDGIISGSETPRPGSGYLQAELAEQDGYVYSTESWLAISILNATDGGTLSFEVDGTPIVFVGTVGESGTEMLLSVPLPSLTIGDHVLTVIDDTTGQTAVVPFPVREIITTPATGPLAPPAVTPSARWAFIDPAGLLATYDFSVNPEKMSSPHPQRLISTEHTTHPDGQPILFEGRSSATDWTVEGAVLSIAQHNAMEAYQALDRQFWVVDHINRGWLVSLESIEWTEIRSTDNPDTMRYVMKFLIYEGPVATS